MFRNIRVQIFFHPLSFFILSHPPILANSVLFSSCDNHFLGVVRNQVSLGYPNRNPHIRSYRGILRTYLWYIGGCRQIPTEKNVSGSKLCRRDGGILAKSDDIWLSGRHVADMSATFSAKPAVRRRSNAVTTIGAAHDAAAARARPRASTQARAHRAWAADTGGTERGSGGISRPRADDDDDDDCREGGGEGEGEEEEEGVRRRASVRRRRRRRRRRSIPRRGGGRSRYRIERHLLPLHRLRRLRRDVRPRGRRVRQPLPHRRRLPYGHERHVRREGLSQGRGGPTTATVLPPASVDAWCRCRTPRAAPGRPWRGRTSRVPRELTTMTTTRVRSFQRGWWGGWGLGVRLCRLAGERASP